MKKELKPQTKEKIKKPSPKKGIPRIKTPAILQNPGGRPSEFDEAAPKIINSIRGGNTYECASGCARVCYGTFNRWMKLGEEDGRNGITDSKFYKFFKDIKQAECEAEQRCVEAWQSFIPDNWQAAKEFLSRRNHEKWGAKDKVDVTSNGETVGKPFFMPMKEDE